LPGKDTDTYKILFSELRTALIDEFESIGCDKLILMDCELAAHNAVESVFPEFTVRSCNFHFTKNVLDYAKNNGLKKVMNTSDFANWIGSVLGKLYICLFI